MTLPFTFTDISKQIGLPQSAFSAPLSSVIKLYQIIHEHNQDTPCLQSLLLIKQGTYSMYDMRERMQGDLSVWQQHMKAKWLQDVGLLAPCIFI